MVSASLWPHRLYSPWDSPGQNTGVGNLSLLQGLFPTQGLKPGFPLCRRILHQLSHKGIPRMLKVQSIPMAWMVSSLMTSPSLLGPHSPLFSLHNRFWELLSVPRKSHTLFYPSDFVLAVSFPPVFSGALSPLSDLKLSTISAEAFLTVQYRQNTQHMRSLTGLWVPWGQWPHVTCLAWLSQCLAHSKCYWNIGGPVPWLVLLSLLPRTSLPYCFA